MEAILKPIKSQREGFDDILRTLDSALAVLSTEYGITVPLDSHLGRSCDDIRKEVERNRGVDPILQRPNMFALFRNTSGVFVMLKRILAAHATGRLTDAFRPHLELLGTSVVSQASTYAENHVGSDHGTKQASDKVFELTVGLAAAAAGTNVRLEPPLQRPAKSTNPDVLVDINGSTWGFACKVAGSGKPDAIFRLIGSGVSQINASPAQRGCVVLNLRNAFEHDVLNPIVASEEAPTDETHYRAPTDDLVDQIIELWYEHFHKDMKAKFDRDDGGNSYQDLFKGGKSIFGWLAYLETVPVVNRNGKLAFGSVCTCMHLYPAAGVLIETPSAVIALQRELVRPI